MRAEFTAAPGMRPYGQMPSNVAGAPATSMRKLMSRVAVGEVYVPPPAFEKAARAFVHASVQNVEGAVVLSRREMVRACERAQGAIDVAAKAAEQALEIPPLGEGRGKGKSPPASKSVAAAAGAAL